MTTEVLSRPNVAARAAWWATVLVTIPVAVLAFTEVFRGPAHALIQGPLAVDPDLGERLATVLPATFITWSQIGIHVAGFTLFVGVGLLIAARSSENLPLLASAMLIALSASLFAPLSELTGRWAAAGRVLGEVTPRGTAGFWISLAGVLLVAFLIVFPSGRLQPVGTAVLFVLVLVGMVTAIAPGWALDPRAFTSPWRQLWTAAVPVIAVGAAWWKLRGVEGDKRRQARPVLVALSVMLMTYLVLVLLRPELAPDAFGLVLVTPRLEALYGINTLLLLTVAVFAFPVSIVLAVVRYRLFEIDLLVNRALVYGSLTAVVTLIFGAVTMVTAATVGGVLGHGFTGQYVGQAAALAGVLTGTVMVGGLRPMRRRLQRAVDRRFYREKFDAEQSLEALMARLGDVVDRKVLNAEVSSLFEHTLQPEWASLLSAEEIPIGLDVSGGEAVLTPQPGVAVAVPLLANERLTGVLLLGNRRSAIPYRGLDFAYLKRVADRVGPALRMVELVERQEADRNRREKVEQELSVARRIQRELLPRQVPQPEGWEFRVHYEPAREVGGDFYDFYDLGPGRIGVAVGDVTDKGMPAALVMASCRTVLRGTALGDLSLGPGEVLARANQLLVGDIPHGMFITCGYGILELASGGFLLANAGHNPPQQLTANVARELRARGMPLGLMSGMEYEELATTLSRGEKLLLSSDGVTEAHNPNGEMFGFERMRSAIASSTGGAIEALLAAQGAFSGLDWQQEDDVTLIEIHRLE